jgi:cytochrome c biogenesis protein CcmG/thiol:disulfide interchange protein DsbE
MNVFKQTRFILPLIIFLFIIGFLWRGLSLHPNQIPSPLINHAAPAFELPDLYNTKKTITQKDFLGQVTLLNVWATWCYACAEEHAELVELATKEHINFIGLNYKDDTTTAKQWLKENGNPYHLIAVDQTGDTAIDWGVYGAPETFIIDKKGIIRYKHIGPITAENWQQTLKPLIEKMNLEAT